MYYRLENTLDNSKPISGLNPKDYNFIDAQFMPNNHRIISVTEQRECFIIEANNVILHFKIEDTPFVKATFGRKEEDSKDEATFDIQLSAISNSTINYPGSPESKKENFVVEKKYEPEPKLMQTPIIPPPENEPEKKVQKNIETCPSCMAIGSNRFAIGWTNTGKVSLYEIKANSHETKPEVLLSKIFSLGDDPISITSICFNQTEEYMTLVSSHNKQSTQIYFANIPQIEAIQAQSLCPLKELLEKGNITGSINAISLSFSKSHAATVGEDHTTRIWEYSDGFNFVQTIVQKFNCDLYDVSINQTATQIAMGTSEGIKVYNVIGSEDLKLAIDVSGKISYAVQYSNCGHLLAGGFGNHVLIIDAATLETKYTLGPHRSFVTQVSWSDSDLFMSSACKGGSIIVWGNKFELYNIADQHLLTEAEALALKTAQTMNKYEFARINVAIIGLIYDDEYDLCITLGADRVLEILSDHAANQYFYHKFENVIPTSICLCKTLRVLFIGLSNGSVRAMLWPMKPKSAMEDFHDYPIQLTDITSIKISHDQKHLVSVSKDGTIAVLKITEIFDGIEGMQGAPDMKRRKGDISRIRPHEIMDSLCLTYHKGIKDKLAMIQKLQEDKKNIYDQGTEKETIMQKIHEQEIAEIMDEHEKLMASEKAIYRRQQEQYEAECKRLESERHRLIEENNLTLEKMEENNKKEQRAAFDLNNRKLVMLEKQRQEFRTQVDYIQKYLKEQLANIETTYQGKYEELKTQHNELLDKINTDGINFDEVLEQCELEYEKEIEENKKVAGVQEKKANLKLTELQREQETLEKEIEKINRKIRSKKDKENTINDEVMRAKQKKANIDLKVQELEEKLKEQQDAILKKEGELKEMKGKNSHLDNLKCILDHKIESLDNEKEPLEKQIKKLEEQVRKMHQDLEREAELKKKLDEELRNVRKLLEDADTRKKEKVQDVENLRRKLLILQHHLICAVKEPIENWDNSLKNIGGQFFITEDGGLNEENTIFDTEYLQIKDELGIQKEWLEQKLSSIKSINTLKEQERGIALKIMEKENNSIIADSNKLRNQFEFLKCKVASLEDKYKSLQKLIANIGKGDDNATKQIRKYMQPSLGKVPKSTTRSVLSAGRTIRKTGRSISTANFRSPNIQIQEEEKIVRPENKQLGKLIGTMQLNRELLESQNNEMAQLQEKVSQFLRTNDRIPEEKTEENKNPEEIVSPQRQNHEPERERGSASTGSRTLTRRTMYSDSSRKAVSRSKKGAL